jgi:hypothetical protein
MALPKILHPTFELVVPSSLAKIKLRPMLVKEEKILLMAKAGDDKDDMLVAIRQVVNNCIIDETFDLNKLTLFDLEFLFLKIRSTSVSNIAKIVVTDSEDKKQYSFDVDLNLVEVKFPDNVEKNIKMTDTSGILMKFPEASLYSDKEFWKASGDELMSQFILRCVDKFYSNDEMFDFGVLSNDEKLEFVDNLDIPVYEKMRVFMGNMPSLYYKIEYENSMGTKREIVLDALPDFFTF